MKDLIQEMKLLKWEENEISENEFVLKSIIPELLELLSNQTELYSDTRKKLVENQIKKHNYTLNTNILIDIPPSLDGFAIDRLRKLIQTVSSRLKQVQNERENANVQVEKMKEQLINENNYLKNEISVYREKL